MSLNLHAVGLHFVESITGIEEIPAVDPALCTDLTGQDGHTDDDNATKRQGHYPYSQGLVVRQSRFPGTGGPGMVVHRQ